MYFLGISARKYINGTAHDFLDIRLTDTGIKIPTYQDLNVVTRSYEKEPMRPTMFKSRYFNATPIHTQLDVYEVKDMKLPFLSSRDDLKQGFIFLPYILEDGNMVLRCVVADGKFSVWNAVIVKEGYLKPTEITDDDSVQLIHMGVPKLIEQLAETTMKL